MQSAPCYEKIMGICLRLCVIKITKSKENDRKRKRKMKKTNHENVQKMNFDQLFKQISPEEICDNVFTLVGKIFSVITAGKEDHYNSMTAAGVVWGCFLKNPPPGVFFEQPIYARTDSKRANIYDVLLPE